MKLFVSKGLSDGNSFKRKSLISIVAGILLMMIVAVGAGLGTAASGGGLPSAVQWLITLGLIAVVIAICVVMYRIGENVYRDALVFCLTEKGILYAVDARDLAPAYSGLWGKGIRLAGSFFRGISQTGDILRQITEENMIERDMLSGKFKKYAVRIDKVVELKCVSNRKYVRCDAARNGARLRVRYDVTSQSEELIALLSQRSALGADTVIKTYTKHIALSCALMALVLVLCVLSYPTIAILPGNIYNICLCSLAIPIILLLTFIIKRRRGD